MFRRSFPGGGTSWSSSSECGTGSGRGTKSAIYDCPCVVRVLVMELACGQYGDVVPSLVVAAKSHVYAEYQNVSSSAATAAATAASVNEKPINSLKVRHTRRRRRRPSKVGLHHPYLT